MSDEKAIYNVYKSYLSTGSLKKFITDVKTHGIHEDDPRMKGLSEITTKTNDQKLDYDTFSK